VLSLLCALSFYAVLKLRGGSFLSLNLGLCVLLVVGLGGYLLLTLFAGETVFFPQDLFFFPVAVLNLVFMVVVGEIIEFPPEATLLLNG
jgi:hypothetical protein